MSLFSETPMERAVALWEYSVVDAGDRAKITAAQAAAVCAHVWELCRMPGKPPSVRQLTPDDPDYDSSIMAGVDAETNAMDLMGPCNTVTVLHEIAHQITEDPLDRMELRPLVERVLHGPVWLGNYLWLLDRLMGPKYNTFRLRSTMQAVMRPAELPYHPIIWGVPRPGL